MQYIIFTFFVNIVIGIFLRYKIELSILCFTNIADWQRKYIKFSSHFGKLRKENAEIKCKFVLKKEKIVKKQMNRNLEVTND